MTADKWHTLCLNLANGAPLEPAIVAAGLRWTQFQTLQTLGRSGTQPLADFLADIEHAISHGEMMLVYSLTKVAHGCDYHASNVPDTKALMWLLEHRYPERWAKTVPRPLTPRERDEAEKRAGISLIYNGVNPSKTPGTGTSGT